MSSAMSVTQSAAELLRRATQIQAKLEAQCAVIASTCDNTPSSESTALSSVTQWARDVQGENGQLRAVLEEFQSAMDLIMSKHRSQVRDLLRDQEATERTVDLKVAQEKEKVVVLEDEVVRLTAKIQEMQAVMHLAVELDTERADLTPDADHVRLQTENTMLRELLQISNQTFPATPKADEEAVE